MTLKEYLYTKFIYSRELNAICWRRIDSKRGKPVTLDELIYVIINFKASDMPVKIIEAFTVK